MPVHVSAESMVGERQLHDALADGAVSAVGLRLNDPDPAELFRREPIPEVPWLILIDGVDEVLDPAARAGLLHNCHYWRRDGKIPVRAGEPAAARQRHAELRRGNATVYEIQPFTPAQLPEFAERWFTVLGVPDPAGVTRRYQRQLATGRLLPLAQLPLIATMICVVFAEDADRELPHSRVELSRLTHRHPASTSPLPAGRAAADMAAPGLFSINRLRDIYKLRTVPHVPRRYLLGKTG